MTVKAACGRAACLVECKCAQLAVAGQLQHEAVGLREPVPEPEGDDDPVAVLV